MATPTFRQTPTHNAADQAQFQLTQAADVGDWLVAIHGADFYEASDVGAPTGGHTWTQRAVDINGTDLPHLKLFTAEVTSGGNQAVTFPTVVDTVHYGWLGVLVGVDSLDGAAGGGSASAASSHVAPTVAPASGDALLLCSWIGGGDVDDATAVSYVAIPAAMTDGGHQQGSTGPFHSAHQAASEVLASSGGTGTRTATFSRSAVYASVSVAFAGAAAAEVVSVAAAKGGGYAHASTAKVPTVVATGHGGGQGSAQTTKVGAGLAVGSGGAAAMAAVGKVATGLAAGVGGASAGAVVGKLASGAAAAPDGGLGAAVGWTQVTTARQTRAVAAGGGAGRGTVFRLAGGSGTGSGGNFGAHRPGIQTVVRPFIGSTSPPNTGTLNGPSIGGTSPPATGTIIRPSVGFIVRP